MLAKITLIAFLIDKFFGEFLVIKHPVVFMGDYILWFEKNFYKDSIIWGVALTASLLFIVFFIAFLLELFLPWWLLGIIASMGIASKMLYDSIIDVLKNPENIRFLVSRDSLELSQNDINKATIETYAENLSDGVIAPLFYLFCFGFTALFIYKAINTLDSMVGYKNEKYINFGKFSAKLDDLANLIPARLTAFLISVLFLSYKSLKAIFKYGKLHESPNAGYPISAMAGAIGVILGGDTKYFGKIKKKSKFGNNRVEITKKDVLKTISIKKRLDYFLLIFFLYYIF